MVNFWEVRIGYSIHEEDYGILLRPIKVVGIDSMPKRTECYFDKYGFLITPLPKTSRRLKTALRIASTEALAFASSSKAGAGRAVFEGRYETLKRAVYQMGGHCYETGHYDLLERYARSENNPKKHNEAYPIPTNAPAAEENPFYYAYYLVAGNNLAITRLERSRGSRQLLYAYQHNVPVELLSGFIRQSGGQDEVARKIKEGKREPWFEWRKAQNS